MLTRVFGIALTFLVLHKAADVAFCQETSLSPSRFGLMVRAQNGNLTQVWSAVGIPVGEFLWVEGTPDLRTLGERSTPDVVAVHVTAGWEHRVVLFRREEQPNADWRVLGHIDYRDRASQAPPRLWRSSLGDFLMVHDETNSGSGVGAEKTTWYQVDVSGVNSVLSYPSRSYEAGYWVTVRHGAPLGPSRTIRSSIRSVGSFEDSEEVTIGISAVFQDMQTNAVVCSVEKNLVYTRRDDKAFVLDYRRSAATQSDIDALFDISKYAPPERLQPYCPPGVIPAR